MGYIFVSYSRKQLYFAESVVLSLQKAGLETWFDLQKLTPGINWAHALQDGYSNCEKLIFIASQSAISSPYVQVEWETALQNSREIIVVLAEAVTLPDTLSGCAVYDARASFERVITSLIAYLRGEKLAQHDPIPQPRKSALPDKMPFDIWFTLAVLSMPSITIWFATLILGLSNIPINIHVSEKIDQYVPGTVLLYFFGFLYGVSMAQGFPIGEFIRHEISHRELAKTRRKLLQVQVIAALVCWGITIFLSNEHGQRNNLIGLLLFIFPLLSTYWAFWTLNHSPDILRWLPSGDMDQDLREQIQGELLIDQPAHTTPEPTVIAQQPLLVYTLHYHPADSHNATFIKSILEAEGCQLASQNDAAIHLILVSNRTSKQWLLETNTTLSGRIIHILATNIFTPPELTPLLQTQWVDFRTGRAKVIQGLVAQLLNEGGSTVEYAMQISPTAFDNKQAFPKTVSLLIGSFALFVALILGFIWYLLDQNNWLLLGFVPVIFYTDALVMRRISLPAWLNKILGYRVAWFASPALSVQDPIGNHDRYYASDMVMQFIKRSS